MNFVRSHYVAITGAVLLALATYITMCIVAPELADNVALAYIISLMTLSVVWDYSFNRGKK